MPTSELKNVAYRILLPFFAPSSGKHPISSVSGHNLNMQHSFVSLIRKHHVLGSAVLLTSGNNTSLICTSSYSPCHKSSPDTFFRVASITKTATAILCMRLIDQSILSLDQPVNSFFQNSESQHALSGITLRHLLSHTSGLIDPPNLETSLENGIPFTDLVPLSRSCAPGHSFHYSNLGFGLIGCLLESIFNLPVGSIYREYLFEPLGMNATLEGCLLPAEQIMPVTRILPYHKNHDLIITPLGSNPLLNPDPLRHYGHTAGSMYTDIKSLQKLINVLIHKENDFLSVRSREKMAALHASYGKLSPTLSYGLGLLRINDHFLSDDIVLGHQGFAYGCADGAFWEPKTGNSVIILNGGCSEARKGRLGLLNRDIIHWSFRKELPSWS